MKNITLPALLKDGYKVGHKFQYPQETELVYSNMTPRESRIEGVDEIVFFGLQYFIERYLIEDWNENFFNRPRQEVIDQYDRRITNYLGPIDSSHIGELHDLGYLPIRIKALPEGTSVPIRVPVLTIVNTHDNFSWLTNMLETIMSCILWQPITSATIAREYLKNFRFGAYMAGETDWSFIGWQGHDFSFRGMSSLETAMTSGAGHLLSFDGTDTIPAIDFLEAYYGADCEKELIGGSVPATEHSVMCMGGDEDELETFRRLLKTYPTGIVSIVSDTWDFWNVLTNILPQLKDEIMARDGKLVIRPDSGDPVKIIVGDPDAEPGTPEYKGAIELLHDVFGGTKTETGYITLDSHIGLIYGDSITLDRQTRILMGLHYKGFSSFNVVLGIGSFTYQYNTRDTFGFAIKATYGVIDGVGKEIFKAPKTDSGMKNSAKGLLAIGMDADGEFYLREQVSSYDEQFGFLQTVFEDSVQYNKQTLAQIRELVRG